MLNYFVVFEHTQKTGGYTGVRFYVGYKNAGDFQKHNRSEDDAFKVVTEGVTEDQARNAIACTPEICRLTALVEESFESKKGQINFKIFREQLTNVIYAIMEDRLWRFDHHLKLPEVCSLYQSNGGKTLKDRILCAVIEAFPDPHGNIGDMNRLDEVLLSIFMLTS